MSTSSVGSTVSVSFHGEQQTIDRALEVTVNDIIKHLNHTQLGLRTLACASEQCLPYDEELAIAGKLNDNARELRYLIEDLELMQFDLVSVPNTAEEKKLLKEWKIERKAIEKAAHEEHIAQIKADRLIAKAEKEAMKKMMKETESKMQDD